MTIETLVPSIDQNAPRCVEHIKAIPELRQLLSAQERDRTENPYASPLLYKMLGMIVAKKRQQKLLCSLSHVSKVCAWINLFVPLMSSLSAALRPLVRVVCYNFEWPYAELWELQNHQQHRSSATMILREFHVIPCLQYMKKHTQIEKIGHEAQQSAVPFCSSTLPGKVFRTGRTEWAADTSAHCVGEKRARMMQDCGMTKAFALPVPSGDQMSYVLVFYGQEPKGFAKPGPEKFTTFTANRIGTCYKEREMPPYSDIDEMSNCSEESDSVERITRQVKRLKVEKEERPAQMFSSANAK